MLYSSPWFHGNDISNADPNTQRTHLLIVVLILFFFSLRFHIYFCFALFSVKLIEWREFSSRERESMRWRMPHKNTMDMECQMCVSEPSSCVSPHATEEGLSTPLTLLHSTCTQQTQFPSTFTQFNSMEHHNAPVQSSNLTQTSQRFSLEQNFFFFFFTFFFFTRITKSNIHVLYSLACYWFFSPLNIISFNGLTIDKTGFILSKKKKGSKYEYYS